MSNFISQIEINGNLYDIKDAAAREAIANIFNDIIFDGGDANKQLSLERGEEVEF